MNDQNDNEIDKKNIDETTLPDHAGVNILPPFIYMMFLSGAIILETLMGFDILQWSAQLSAGIILISLGTGLITWCFFRFANAGTNLPPNKPTTVIISDGPYSISRNPIYVGLTIIYLGTVILLDIFWGYILIFPLIYGMQKYVIANEEKYLTRKFGDEYLNYQSKTRRWL